MYCHISRWSAHGHEDVPAHLLAHSCLHHTRMLLTLDGCSAAFVCSEHPVDCDAQAEAVLGAGAARRESEDREPELRLRKKDRRRLRRPLALGT